MYGPRPQNVGTQVRTTLRLDREYLSTGTGYHESENSMAYYSHFLIHVCTWPIGELWSTNGEDRTNFLACSYLGHYRTIPPQTSPSAEDDQCLLTRTPAFFGNCNSKNGRKIRYNLAYIVGVNGGNRTKLFRVMWPGRGMKISVSNFVVLPPKIFEPPKNLGFNFAILWLCRYLQVQSQIIKRHWKLGYKLPPSHVT